VADASAVVDLILASPHAGRIAASITNEEIHVPALCDVEIVSAIRHGLRRGRMTPARAGEALRDYLDLPLHRHGHELLLTRVVELRENFSAYDAAYVALAEALEASLLTVDGPLRRTIETHTSVAVLMP